MTAAATSHWEQQPTGGVPRLQERSHEPGSHIEGGNGAGKSALQGSRRVWSSHRPAESPSTAGTSSGCDHTSGVASPVDGTLIYAWASMKSFVGTDDGTPPPPAGGRNAERHFRNEKRSNETHASTTEPDARLYRKGDGREGRMCFMGHVLMEDRHGLVLHAAATRATGTAEREATLELLDRHHTGRRRITLGADKGTTLRRSLAI